ncbi:MAG: branched-chain amino acid ABC transporter permease [Geminicoccaceae bacterium]|nr:MAG: branched-chain amino acid ABC transporter permease [Geminicoccaceae bacterium]
MPVDPVLLLDALAQALTLFLVASGLAVTFGLVGVINLAHGELLLAGAYTALAVERAGLGYWAGLALAPLVVGLLGFLLDLLVIRRLRERPLDTLLATWAAALVVRQTVVALFGPASHTIQPPIPGSVVLLGAPYPVHRLLVMGLALLVAALLAWLLFATRLGLMIRGAIADRTLAAVSGLAVRRLEALAFAFGAGLAGLAGAATAPLLSVDPQMGLGFLLPAFLAVLVAPGGGPAGTAIGAALVGGGESLVAAFASPVLAQLAVLAGAVVLLRRVAGRRAGRER